MKKIMLTVSLLAVLPLLLVGCASGKTKVVDKPDGRIITPDGFDMNDYLEAAQALSQELLKSGNLDRVSKPPAIVVLGRIQNNSDDRRLNTQLVSDRIREVLTSSQKAAVELAYGVTGADGTMVTDNPTGTDYNKINRWKKDSKSQVKPVDFFLFGSISSTSARAGNLNEITLTFRMTLSNNENQEIWSKVFDKTKQGKRASVGIVK